MCRHGGVRPSTARTTSPATMSVKDSSPNAVGGGAATPAERVRLRLLALQVLAHRSGPASGGASQATTAANAAYDDLVRVAALRGTG